LFFNITIRHFSKGHQAIFSDFNWTINDKENWAIVGNIGSGKTTLLKLISGIEYLPKENGEFQFSTLITKKEMEYISFTDESKWIKRKDFYYQQRYYTSFTEEEMKLNEFISFDNFTEEQHRFTYTLLEKYRLTQKLEIPFIQLSNGQKNKSILIKALLSPSRLLLLDNPFIGIDIESRQEILKLIDHLIEQGKRIIYTTSYFTFADSTTNILYLHGDGKQEKIERKDFDKVKNNSQKQDKSAIIANTLSSEKTIELKNVTISYTQKNILEAVNWTVLKGEKWAVIGNNGSGKSTLLSLLYADHPHAFKNEIYLFGKPRGQQSIWDIKQRIGYLSSEFHLHFNEPLSVVNTVGSGYFDMLTLLRPLYPTEQKQIFEVLTSLGIAHLLERRFLTLSTGEQRLVLFARAIIKKPELLILDEPYQGLDINSIARCNNLLQHFLTNEHTLVFTTHYTEEIPECVNKFLHLENGKIIA
jgi:molybdate transport system ATP-binding protein